MKRLIISSWLLLAMAFVQAGTPLWTFTPLTPTKITVPVSSTATVQYQVTNQSKRVHTLVMTPIPGITQVTTAGHCPLVFVLGYQQSCLLTLFIESSSLSGNVIGGPVVCDQANPLQCYRPSQANSLKITKGRAVSFTVGGRTFGLLGTLVLVNNGSEALTLNADGTFTFPTALPPGSTYSITVQNQPATQTCTVSNGSGTIANANIRNIRVNCSTNARTISGTVTGLAPSESVVLQNNGGNNLTVNSNGTFTFSAPVAQGAPYNVTILTQPTTQTCTVTNGSGTAGATNINNVQVTCATNAYTVGGNVSGLTGTVVLQNNGTDNLTLTSDGSFTFPTPVAQGATYQVTILTQPASQNCTVSNGSGIMGGANVTNVAVNCADNTTNLTISTSNLVLSVTGLIEYGMPGNPNSGVARTITITNTGSLPAFNLVVSSADLPTGTTSSSDCPTTLAAGASCTITVTPGNTASSDGTNPCSTGTQASPSFIQVFGSNTNQVGASVYVLSYGCFYQGGYVYALNDLTPANTSIGGKLAALSDQFPLPQVFWSTDNSSPPNVAYDRIFGISETSTTASPNPSSGQVTGQIACDGAIDGACNTNNIYVYYQTAATGAPINLSTYAAGICKQNINGLNDWYLPAICELGYEGTSSASIAINCGTMSEPSLQNIQSSLIDFGNLISLTGTYWSSTELASDPVNGAWLQVLSPLNSGQIPSDKGQLTGVLCTRIF
ncbi:hypothetical protein [Legionella gresilensis]|uniref:hypothetical protein n=1 Tax=Legionella gresilensis TaxID=91823 RepID=UPI0010410D98|nr:hypothetical protein [Legionella gresilensis]